ncbi:MAG: nitrogen regulation protein NR(I) [Gammaproteobacteria bacterium]|nr:nitrogen regulation protein NR(I) [Gammaproteobacteria bacterium]
MANENVWIIDDDSSIRWVLERALAQAGYDTESFGAAEDVLERVDYEAPDAVVSDIRMPGRDGLELLSILANRHPDLPVIIMTAHSDLDSAVAAYQSGAFEYLPKPFDIDDAVATVQRAVLRRREQQPDVETPAPPTDTEIIGQATAMQEVFRAIGRLARSNITVMIEGASGTGKELVARALHRHSQRAGNALVALNMAAIPSELIESELFGHERGAFTGAKDQRVGRFEQANGGTLFLDEIGDMPADAQTRLLRVLAEGEFFRVGGRNSVQVDVRIITATHRDLRALVAEGRFREDLYHRLNVIRVHVPTLAERRSDIPLLADYFLKQAATELGGERKVLLADTLSYLQTLDWPGNVRQLENTCNWLTVMAPGREVHIADLPAELRGAGASIEGERDWQTTLAEWARRELDGGRDAILSDALPAFETTMIRVALEKTGGRKRDAANLLGWGRNTLTRKLADLGINA